MLVHTTKDQISEAVVGIVVFASVSSRSMDRDPSWTPDFNIPEILWKEVEVVMSLRWA